MMPQAMMQTGPNPTTIIDRPHRVDLEELTAHLVSQHACQHAGEYVQAVMAERIESKAKTTPSRADGTIHVELDGAAVLGEVRHRNYLDKLHRQHSHDWEGAAVPAILHPWITKGEA